MHEKRVARAQFRAPWTALVVCAALPVPSIRFGRPMRDGVLRTAVLLAPMLGFALAIRAIARHVARIAAYQRMRLRDKLGLSFATTAGLTLSDAFPETAGSPRLSMFRVWMAMGASCAIITLARWRQPR